MVYAKYGVVVIAVFVANAATGCALGSEEEASKESGNTRGSVAEATGEASSAFSSHKWSTFTNSGHKDYDLGPDANTSCFLSGVNGGLQQDNLQSIYPGAVIYHQNGHLYLGLTGGNAYNTQGANYPLQLSASVTCVNGVRNRVTTVWGNATQSGATIVAPVNLTGRQCFLTGVQNNGQGDTISMGFATMQDYGEVASDGSNWRIYGEGNNPQAQNWIAAECIDVGGVDGSGYWWDHAGSGQLDKWILPNVPANNPAVECMLTGMGGDFHSYNSGIPPQLGTYFSQNVWQLWVEGYVLAYANCAH